MLKIRRLCKEFKTAKGHAPNLYPLPPNAIDNCKFMTFCKHFREQNSQAKLECWTCVRMCECLSISFPAQKELMCWCV